MAEEMGVPLLGRIPLDPRIGRCCDAGLSFVAECPESPAAAAYAAVVTRAWGCLCNN